MTEADAGTKTSPRRGRTRLWVPLVPVFLALSASSTAHAWDGWGLGVGTGFGVHQSSSPNNAGDSMFVADINVRARFLWVLGLDLRFNMQDESTVALDDMAQYTARYRTSAMLYVVPTPVASVYVAGGIGALQGKDLLDPHADGASYHAGLGVEVPLSGRFAFDASFLLLIPGEKSLERDLDRRVDLEIAAFKASGQKIPPEVPTSVPTSDYVSASNFELMLRAMMVF